jgi:hypothetical protein
MDSVFVQLQSAKVLKAAGGVLLHSHNCQELLMTRDMGWSFRGLRAFVAAVLGAVMATWAVAAPVPALTPELEELAEVWVQGKRLSNDIETAENDFFRRFNKKNKKGLYDIQCGLMSLHPDSMIMRRVCVPGYVSLSEPIVLSAPNSLGDCAGGYGNGYSYSSGYGYSCGSSITTVIPGIPLGLLAMQHSEKFIDNLLNVTNSDPQLLERARHLEKLYREMLQVQLKYVDIDVDNQTREKVEKVARKLAKSRAVSTRVR